MGKNGSRTISFGRYRTTDLLLFAAILVAADLLGHYAAAWFPGGAMFTFSFMAPIVLALMMRWGWWGVLYAVADGFIYGFINGAEWHGYLAYCLGNAFIVLMLVMIKYMGRDRIRTKWYFTALYGVLGWLCVVVGRSVVYAFMGNNFFTVFGTQVFAEIISLVAVVLVLCMLRRLDGMLEYQKDYIIRLDNERREMQRRDIFGDEPIDMDEQALAALDKPNDDSLY